MPLVAHFKNQARTHRDLLAAQPLFAGLPVACLDELTAHSRLLRLSAHQDIFRAGEPIREAYVLLEGSAKRWITLSGQASKLIELIELPQMIGLGELFAGKYFSATCTTISACQLVAINWRKLRPLIRQDPDFGARLLQALAQRQCEIEFDVTGHHAAVTGTQRVLDYLLELTDGRHALAGETTVNLKPSKKMIAARIGMTPESFSRSLRQLSDKGVIVVDGSTVHIQNAALVDTESGDSTRRLSFLRKSRSEEMPREHSLSSGALVNLCGRMRMLSQRMAIAWGLIAAQITPARSRSKLRQFNEQFERNLKQLERLAPALGLLVPLRAVSAIWSRYQKVLLADPVELAQAAGVLALSEEILTATDALTRCAQDLVGGDGARYVNMAGRNRALSQRIGKFFLFRDWAGCYEQIMPHSSASCVEFESNLVALRQSGTQLPELLAQLTEVSAQWQRFVRSLVPELAQPNKSKHVQSVLAEGERLLRHVDTTVKLYERLSK